MGRARINQTRVQTGTGIWNVIYNAENRPVTFSRSNTNGTTTRVTCTYDHMGRRATKKVETIAADTTATTTLHQRYIYRGYLQVACCDLTATDHPHLWLITWDPSQPVATRPLAISKDGTWHCYGWDLTKNVCEVFSHEGYINNTVIYSYTPYGTVSAEGNVSQPIQWSSEFYDDELGLVYYNYRHYNASVGRWFSRDITKDNHNLYTYIANTTTHSDRLGLLTIGIDGTNYDVTRHKTQQSNVKPSNVQTIFSIQSNSRHFSQHILFRPQDYEGETRVTLRRNDDGSRTTHGDIGGTENARANLAFKLMKDEAMKYGIHFKN